MIVYHEKCITKISDFKYDLGLSPPSKLFILTVPLRYFFCGSFVSCDSYGFASVHCCLVVTCWERADLLVLVGNIYCIFVTFPCGILCQVWCSIVAFPDLCCLFFYLESKVKVIHI